MKQQPQTPISNRGFDAQFLGMVPRYNPLTLDGVVVSIDSVRLKFTCSKSMYDYGQNQRYNTLNRVLFALTSESLYCEGLFEIQVTPEAFFKIGNYQRTVNYTHTDGWSFAVLVGRFTYDSSAKMLAPEVVLDFNPNKVPAAAWQRVALILRGYAVSVSVQRYDLAIDFPIERSSLTLQQRPGSEFRRFVDRKGAITEYTGDRSHHAAVKLYDKGAELDADLTCTRLEITVDPKRFSGVSGLLPTITSTTPLALSTDFGDLPFQVQAVLIHPDLFPVLKASASRNTWAKYEKLIRQYSQANGETVLTLTEAQCKEIDRYIHDYLAKLKQACTTF